MLVGVAAIAAGALLLALAGVGLWQVRNNANQRAAGQAVLEAAAESPAPSTTPAQGAPPSIDTAAPVAPLPSASDGTEDSEAAPSSTPPDPANAIPSKRSRAPKADSYR
jgi:hypothetical protein